MGILVYLIILRIKRIFDFKTHPIKTIGVVLSFGISIFYGYTVAYIHNSPDFQEKMLFQNDFTHYIILSLAVITFLRGLFPSYIPLKKVITNSYPLNTLERFLYNITNEFIYPFYFGIVLFISTLALVIDGGRLEFFIIALSWIVIAHFLKRLVQFFIEFHLQEINIFLILTPIFLFTIFYYLFFSDAEEYLNYVISFILLIILISANYLVEFKSKEPKIRNKVNSKKSTQNFHFITLLLNNKTLRTMSLFSIIYKILMLLMVWSRIQKDGEFSFATEILIYLFISLVILFSYFANNIFGFSPTMWLSMNKVGASLLTHSKEILKILFVPLLIDTILTITFFIVSDKLDFANISFYLSNIIVLFAIGVLNSFYFPKQVKSIFSMSGNTSMLGNLFSFLVVTILIILTKYIVYTNLLFSILLTLGLYFLIKDKILNARYKLFQKLFS